MNLFDRINHAIRGLESNLVNAVSALAPWGAPLVPAMLTFWNTSENLGFPYWLAFTSAFVVEALGLSSVRTTLDFIAHNRRYKASYKRMPIIWPVLAFAFYLVLILSVNVSLDWYAMTPQQLIALGGLTLMTIPAALILGVRSLHADLEAEIRQDNEKRRKVSRIKKPEVVVAQPQAVDVSGTLGEYLDAHGISPYEVGQGQKYSPGEIADELNLNPVSVRTSIKRMKDNGR